MIHRILFPVLCGGLWRPILSSTSQKQNYTLNIQGKLVPLCKLTCKDINWILLNSCKDSTPCIQKWAEIFNLEIPTSDYKKKYSNYPSSAAHIY